MPSFSQTLKLSEVEARSQDTAKSRSRGSSHTRFLEQCPTFPPGIKSVGLPGPTLGSNKQEVIIITVIYSFIHTC